MKPCRTSSRFREVVLYPTQAQVAELRIWVKAVQGSAVVGSGTTRVMVVEGAQTTAQVTLEPGPPTDGDGDIPGPGCGGGGGAVGRLRFNRNDISAVPFTTSGKVSLGSITTK